MAKRQRQEQGDTQTREKLDKPPKYKVLIHNDDYTTMEFVIFVLQTVFKHTPAAASRIMLQCHREGVGVAGIFSREVAETRVTQTLDLARENGHPLQCTMEPE